MAVCLRCGMWSLLFCCVSSHLKAVLAEDSEICENLRLGQYLCKDPKIDEATQEPENCRDTTAWVECLPAPNISCRLSNGTEIKFNGEEVGFNKTIPCRNV
ncbi:TM2 domain-containing protein 1-like [Brachyistius frenatus]